MENTCFRNSSILIFWLMKGDFVNEQTLQQTINAIREINGVQLVVELTNEKIRNKEHLVF